jgi:hypothetical protein
MNDQARSFRAATVKERWSFLAFFNTVPSLPSLISASVSVLLRRDPVGYASCGVEADSSGLISVNTTSGSRLPSILIYRRFL